MGGIHGQGGGRGCREAQGLRGQPGACAFGRARELRADQRSRDGGPEGCGDPRRARGVQAQARNQGGGADGGVQTGGSGRNRRASGDCGSEADSGGSAETENHRAAARATVRQRAPGNQLKLQRRARVAHALGGHRRRGRRRGAWPLRGERKRARTRDDQVQGACHRRQTHRAGGTSVQRAQSGNQARLRHRTAAEGARARDRLWPRGRSHHPKGETWCIVPKGQGPRQHADRSAHRRGRQASDRPGMR